VGQREVDADIGEVTARGHGLAIPAFGALLITGLCAHIAVGRRHTEAAITVFVILAGLRELRLVGLSGVGLWVWGHLNDPRVDP